MLKLNLLDSLRVARGKKLNPIVAIKFEINEGCDATRGEKVSPNFGSATDTRKGLNQEKFLISCTQVEST